VRLIQDYKPRHFPATPSSVTPASSVMLTESTCYVYGHWLVSRIRPIKLFLSNDYSFSGPRVNARYVVSFIFVYRSDGRTVQ